MLLQTRPIAVSAAVICFFFIGILGSVGGLSPYTCSKRALIGAAVTYITTKALVRAIEMILMQAMITSQINEDEETSDDRRN
jgi:hypothetical protein